MDQSRHIVKDLRSVLLVADQNGHITRYVPEPTPIIAQPAVQAQQRVIGQMPLQQPVIAVATDTTPQPSSTPKCDEMAAKMPKCTVSVLSLSDADMKEIKAKLARTGNIRSIEAKKKTLPLLKNTNQQSNILNAFKDDAVKTTKVLLIDELVAAFAQKMNFNAYIGMPGIRGHGIVGVSSANAVKVDNLVASSKRNTLSAGVELQQIDDMIRIDLPTTDGQIKSTLLIAPEVFMQLVCMFLNVFGSDDMEDCSSNVDEAVITEISDIEYNIVDNVTIDSSSDDSQHEQSIEDNNYADASDENDSSSTSTSNDSIGRPLSPNSLDAALFALYNKGKVNIDKE